MESLSWLAEFFRKLTSPIKAFSRFLYVWSHWTEISRTLDYYTRQIEDRDKMYERSKKIGEEVYKLEKKKTTLEYEQKIEDLHKLVKDYQDQILVLLRELVQASTIIALYFRESPLLGTIMKADLKPTLKGMVEEVTKQMSSLPPPPTFNFDLLRDVPEKNNR
jgi:hypothetical protein